MIATYIPTTVEVVVRIGKGGSVESIRYSNSNALLQIELDHFFKDATTYRSGCQGRSVTFVVRYLVEGTPTDNPVSEVRFRPPNEFVVICRPLKPILDPLRR